MTRSDVYGAVTERIVEALENGVTAPWRLPWIGGGPRNITSGRLYRGINVFMLAMIGMGKGYTDPRWGTYRAIKSVGGQVREHEKSSWVILWKPVARKRTADMSQDDDPGAYLLLRTYNVFNAEQADGVPPLAPPIEHDPIEKAEEIIREYVPRGPLIQFGGSSAHYERERDVVAIPDLARFTHVEGYYSTLYHELIHSTGHKDRLDRLERTGFGTGPYAKEELVAEMGAAMLCGIAGIDNLDQSAAYLKGWLRPLQDDPKFVVQAAANAQKAADWIFNETTTDSQESENREKVAA